MSMTEVTYNQSIAGGSMKARLEQQGDLYICHLAGRLDYQTVDPFKETCIKNLSSKKVIFNLQNLSFVGSVGIGPFLDTMSMLTKSPEGQLKFCGVQTEFRRIFEASDVKYVEIFEDEQRAKLSFLGYSITPSNSVFLNGLLSDVETPIIEDVPIEGVNSEVVAGETIGAVASEEVVVGDKVIIGQVSESFVGNPVAEVEAVLPLEDSKELS